MKLYKNTKSNRVNVKAVVLLTAIIPFLVVLSTSAGFQQAEAIRFVNVGTEANATIVGGSTNQHLSGNGAPGSFGVNSANLRAHAIAIGDVNGDGIADIISGAPDATFTVTPPSAPPQTRAAAGVVYIVLGKAGLSGQIDPGGAAPPEIIIIGSKAGDKLGFSVAIGDVNGDGIDDISMGAPGADFPGTASPAAPVRNDTGAVFVIFGASALSTPHTIDLATANAANVALFGVNSGDQFGASVAVGNVGGLGTQTPAQQAVKDIFVGAPANNGPDGSSRPSGGAAYLEYGGSQLNPVAGATTVVDLVATPANVIIFGKTGDLLGTSVAIGDINGGGIADLIVGAPLADRTAAGLVPAATDSGAVYSVFGGVNLNPAVGTSKIFDINVTQQNVSVYGAGNKVTPGTDDADHLGFSVAAGDVTGDGTADLVMGAPDADGPTEDRLSTGEAYVIKGGAALNPTVGSEKRIDLFTVDGATLTVFGAQAGDRYGSTVATGNYNTTDNADAIPDLIVGAPGGNSKSGFVSIVFGGANLESLSLRDLFLNQDNIRVVGQAGSNNDLSGKTLRIRQTLTTTDQTVTPFLQQLTVGINATPPFLNDDTQPQFAVGTLTQTRAASTVIPSDPTGVGDLELAPNPSMSLDGTTGFMSVANSATLKPALGSWTIEFWIKRTGPGTGDFPQVIGSRPWTSATDKGWSVALASGGSFKVVAHFADGTSGLDAIQSTTGVALNTWEHWAVVFDRTQLRVQFFRNGALDATVNIGFPATTVDQTDVILVGKDPAGSRVLAATLDDIRVWNTARTAAQIQSNFKSELVGTEAGLAADWNFNAGNANDITANANNGTLGSGASIVAPTDRLFFTGTRLSTFTFPAATTATSTSISFVQTTPAGTTVKIETSLDGVTFQTASSGSGIPSVTSGDELGWAIGTGDVNNNQGGDLVIGAPFANAIIGTGSRTQAGVVYILPSSTSPPPVNVAPTVTVNAPNGGEVLQVGQIFNITWSAADPNGDATIQKFEIRLSTDGGVNYNFTIAPNVLGTARSFAWTVPIGFNTTQARIRVIATDTADTGSLTGQDDSNANFTITESGVTAQLLSPNGGENLRFGQQFTITWTVPAAVSGQVKGFDLKLSTDGGLTFPILIAPSSDPSQPALAAGIRSFLWTVPSTCTTRGRVAVITTSLTNATTSDSSDADFLISASGPTIDTANMFLVADFQLFLLTTAPAGGTEVLFNDATVVEISTDAAGTAFFTFSKHGKIKKGGGKFLSKGTINGQELGTFFPNGATRIIRLTNPPCGITLLRVTRNGEALLPAAADITEAQPVVQQRVWQ